MPFCIRSDPERLTDLKYVEKLFNYVIKYRSQLIDYKTKNTNETFFIQKIINKKFIDAVYLVNKNPSLYVEFLEDMDIFIFEKNQK